MAKFKSKYAELSFYCCHGQRKKFSNGEYETTNKKEIDILDSLIDAVRLDEPTQEKKSEQPKAEEKKEAPRRYNNSRKRPSAK